MSGATRPAIRALLLDIEGTTTPIAFVFETLVPYARRQLRHHLEQHADSAEYRDLLDRLRNEHNTDRCASEDVPEWLETPRAARLDAIARYVDWLMDRDRKSPALKDLQGRIWQDGYSRGELRGEVFSDVPRAFELWCAQQAQIGIFSSGSVLAQQLLFRYSSAGDLTAFLHWHFDTAVGGKTDPASYRRIADAMNVAPASILFISDVVAELDAARRAGMHTRLSIRPGNKLPPPDHTHLAIRTFDDLTPQFTYVQDPSIR